MLRENILNALKELQLEGMSSAYDEIAAMGQKQGHTSERLLLSLMKKLSDRHG
jgi:hypothetical protein